MDGECTYDRNKHTGVRVCGVTQECVGWHVQVFGGISYT